MTRGRTLPRARASVLRYADLGGRWGVTDGESRIWLDLQLLQVEGRCTLAHELIHIDRRDPSPQPEQIEQVTENEVAGWGLASADDSACYWITAAAALADSAFAAVTGHPGYGAGPRVHQDAASRRSSNWPPRPRLPAEAGH